MTAPDYRGGLSRFTLDSENTHLRELLRKTMNELKATNDHVSVVQSRCTELLLENRTLKQRIKEHGIMLKGWNCEACKAFNGEEKEKLGFCRSCGERKQS